MKHPIVGSTLPRSITALSQKWVNYSPLHLSPLLKKDLKFARQGRAVPLLQVSSSTPMGGNIVTDASPVAGACRVSRQDGLTPCGGAGEPEERPCPD